jgi:hypothetical protein
VTAFWDVVPYILQKFTDVSEVLAASIIRTLMMEAVATVGTRDLKGFNFSLVLGSALNVIR